MCQDLQENVLHPDMPALGKVSESVSIVLW